MGSEADIKAFVTDEVAPGVGLWKIPRGFHLLAVTSWGGEEQTNTYNADCQWLPKTIWL